MILLNSNKEKERSHVNLQNIIIKNIDNNIKKLNIPKNTNYMFLCENI